MTGIARAVFRSIHEGKWLDIHYKNQDGKTTCFWAAVKSIDVHRGMLTVDGLHLHHLTVEERSLHIDGIIHAAVVDGTWYPRNQALIEDICAEPQRYAPLFTNTANLRILDYLNACNKLDSTPYKTEYRLLQRIDDTRVRSTGCPLSDEQFRALVRDFRQKASRAPRPGEPVRLQQLGLNLLSLHTKKGLYVLAYRPLLLDVRRRVLAASRSIVLCREFGMNGSADPRERQSIRSFLDADDFALLEDFEANQEAIKDRLTEQNPEFANGGVDDMPYLLAIGRDQLCDLEHQYNGILDLYQADDGKGVPVPLRAFFGDLTVRPRRRPAVPLALLSHRINLDQLVAMTHAFRSPPGYVQGPPGTGKTNTILNILATAFFNERTVLFASYNNHPIDSVVEHMQSLRYRGQVIPFPIIRLGNNDVVAQAIVTIRRLYRQCREMKVFETSLDRNKKERTEQARALARLLQKHERVLDLQERLETADRLLQDNHNLTFTMQLTEQRNLIQAQLRQAGAVTTGDALALLDRDEDALFQYLNFTSAKYIQRLSGPKYEPLRKILESDESPDDLVPQFNRYLSNPENCKAFLRVFPIVATTCSSAYKLGAPEPLFDMVVMDEASQCNTAVSLVPILRGRSLLLVGDPQQLNPVVLLDPRDNERLRRRYGVSDEYDYIQNSIYKCFLACDPVSDEVLLSYHYRCHPRIIEFNNKKYYNGRLHIVSQAEGGQPLVFCDIPGNTTAEKNTAPREVLAILRYLKANPGKDVGIITPFASQRALIERELRSSGLDGQVSCGTVHAFQGDEKDVVIFSLALTDRTHPATYNWLKNNKELINVAVSRARQQLLIFSSLKELERLHGAAQDDDLYELVQYVRTNGTSEVSPKLTNSRALGIKPYSTRTEDAFLQNLGHALDTILMDGSCVIHKEVPISQVFEGNPSCTDLFYTGRFDFVVYQRIGGQEQPVLAIELDGKEHVSEEVVRRRDAKKNAICQEHGFVLIRVPNSYARRYHYIKAILERYFKSA